MKLTNESHKMMTYFIQHNCVMNGSKLTNKTTHILINLYNQINSNVDVIKELRIKNPVVTNITNVNKIPKPITFSPNALRQEIRNHINENVVSSLTYSTNFIGREIKILFLLEEEPTNKLIKQYNNYVEYILIWLNIANKYASNECSKKLTIFIYHTSLLKEMPILETEVLNEIHVNTAFTKTCQTNSEIVIFRKEEWFKVLIHETFHNFGLDFSDLNNEICTSRILQMFPVNSEVNLYESYTEFWARLINIIFCVYSHMKDKENNIEFIRLFKYLMNIEQTFSFFQMVKILNRMGLTYKNLYEKTNSGKLLRKTFYKEDTNVLSYYIITTILLHNYQELLGWCDENNDILLCFKKTMNNMNKYCDFIEDNYKSQGTSRSVNCVSRLLEKVINGKLTKINNYIFRNMRMTVCELG